MKSRRCVLAFAVVIALTAQAKAQAVLDDQTPCSAAVEAFDSHDKEKMREVVAYIFWAARSAPKGGAVNHPFRVLVRARGRPLGQRFRSGGAGSELSGRHRHDPIETGCMCGLVHALCALPRAHEAAPNLARALGPGGCRFLFWNSVGGSAGAASEQWGRLRQHLVSTARHWGSRSCSLCAASRARGGAESGPSIGTGRLPISILEFGWRQRRRGVGAMG